MDLTRKPKGVTTRWFSPENPQGEPERGGLTNQGAKGRPFVSLKAGACQELVDLTGSGTVCRIWATISDRSPEMLRSLRLEMYWDGAAEPAVAAPFGDFFGVGLGQRTPFESGLFSDPEGRSFHGQVPMPFRTGARIIVVNDGPHDLGHFYYDVDVLTGIAHPADTLYFHAVWRREAPNALGQEFAILPRVEGAGRFLGCNLGVVTDRRYEGAWWGEGEVKIRLGNETNPSLCGTGAEDYIGTAWGQGRYTHRTQGCTIADSERGRWAFYRYHLDDPVYFDDAVTVSIQTMGGAEAEKVRALQKAGVPLIPVALDRNDGHGMVPLMNGETPTDLDGVDLRNAGCNFWRQDDWSATAYFYLDRPTNGLPSLPPVADRIAGLG